MCTPKASKSSFASLAKIIANFRAPTAGLNSLRLKNPRRTTVDTVALLISSIHRSTEVSFFLFPIHTECNAPRTKATAVMSSGSNSSSSFVPMRQASAPINTPSLFLGVYPMRSNIAARSRRIDAVDAHPSADLHGSNTTTASSAAPLSKKSATAYLSRSRTNGQSVMTLSFFPIVSLFSVLAARARPAALHSPPYRTRVPLASASSNSARGALHDPIAPPVASRSGLHGRSHSTLAPPLGSLASSRSSASASARVLPHHGGAVSRSVTPSSRARVSPLAFHDVPYRTSRDSARRALEYVVRGASSSSSSIAAHDAVVVARTDRATTSATHATATRAAPSRVRRRAIARARLRRRASRRRRAFVPCVDSSLEMRHRSVACAQTVTTRIS